jgi:hypothetical protein
MINEFLAEVQQLQEANEMMASIIEANEYQEKLDLAISLYEASDTSITESANGDINAIFKDLQKQYKAGVKEAKAAIKTGDTKAAKSKINSLIKICEDGKKKVSAVEGDNGSGFFRSFGLGITTATLALATSAATFYGGTKAIKNVEDANTSKDKALPAMPELPDKSSYSQSHGNRSVNNDPVTKKAKKVAIAAAAVAVIAALTTVVKGLKTASDTKANGREASGNAYKDKVLNALDADINQLKKLASSL